MEEEKPNKNGIEEIISLEDLANIKEKDKDNMMVDRSIIGINLFSDNRIQTSVERLERYGFLKDYAIEIYKRERGKENKVENKIRLKAIGNVSDNKDMIVGKSINEENTFYHVLNSENRFYKEVEHPFLESRVSLAKIPINNFGWLAISSKNNKEPDSYIMNFLMSYAKIIAGAIKHAMDYEKNYELSITDHLTGLYNPRFFKFSLQEEIKRENRNPRGGLSLTLLDLDNFKNYNDVHGHSKGDNVLKSVANILKTRVKRETDLIARSGIGDEFAILMPNTGLDYAIECANNIKNTISQHQFGGEEKSGKIGVSIGIANCPIHAVDGDELYNKADKALYYSKKKGKGTITVYNPNIIF